MTFTDLKNEVKDRLGLTSTADDTRIGRAVNRVYRSITTSIGLKTTRNATVQANTTIGVRFITFSAIEKISSIRDADDDVLTEVTYEELRAKAAKTDDKPTEYAIYRENADTVEVFLDSNPQTAFTLFADGYASIADLSGVQEPAFPESYHDILIHGVLVDEYDKLEKVGLSAKSDAKYEKRLGELRLWMAKSVSKEIFQGKRTQFHTGVTGSGGSGGGTTGSQSYTQTGLITFNRTGAAVGSRYPFAVQTGSEKVANLDADLLDGMDWASITTNVLPSGDLTRNLGAASFRWNIVGATMTGDLLFTDATYDIGKTGTTRPRDLFTSRNATIGGTLGVTGASTLSGTLNVIGATTLDGAVALGNAAADLITIPGTINTDLIFTDASFDIGKTGATRPRDLFLSRNATIGGTLGVTGVSTFTGAAVVGDFRGTEETITVTGTVNNQALGATTTILRCNNATDLTLTGLTGGVAGRIVIIRAVHATGNVFFAHDNLSSTAANRFANLATSGNTPISHAGTLTNGGYAIYQYDGAQSRWVLISHEQGAWITPTFAAGDFTGNGTMTWTVEAGDRVTMAHRLTGRTLKVIVDVATTAIGGTLNTNLRISNRQWGDFVVTKQSLVPIRAIDNDVANIGFMFVLAEGNNIGCNKVDSSNWIATPTVEGNITLEVN